METIFDHNVTLEEVISVTGSFISKELYESVVTKKKAIEDIYYLYLERDDDATANRYLDMLSNDKHKFFQILNVDNGAYKGFKVMPTKKSTKNNNDDSIFFAYFCSVKT